MDAETMRRRAGLFAEIFTGVIDPYGVTVTRGEAADLAAILRAVAAGYSVTDTPDGLVPAEYLREGAAVLVVSADGVG